MQSIPIKTPWKKPERSFVHLFKKGDYFYTQRIDHSRTDDYCWYNERVQAHCDFWSPVVYLGIDTFDEPAFFLLCGSKPIWTKESAKIILERHVKMMAGMGITELAPSKTCQRTAY